MKYAIIADIHANLEALNAVLDDAAAQHCAHHAFLGDYVGYCADPKACLDIVRALNAPCVKGNHDEYAATDLSLIDFNPAAARAIEWTRKQLNDEQRNWLRDLPYSLKIENFTIVHANLHRPAEWQYVFDKLAAAASFQFQQAQLCFYGHTHLPLAFIRDKAQIRGGSYTKLKVQSNDTQYFINPGSVGQPRDGIPNASYLTYDLNTQIIELRRVPYNVAETRRKIRAAGLL
jgi:predicted phosphodiesterase